MPIEAGGGNQGEKPDDPKPPNHNQSADKERAKRDAIRPFKLYKDPTSRTNWTLEAKVEGKKFFIDYGPGLHSLTREEYIERIRHDLRIIEENNDQQKPDQGSEPHQ